MDGENAPENGVLQLTLNIRIKRGDVRRVTGNPLAVGEGVGRKSERISGIGGKVQQRDT